MTNLPRRLAAHATPPRAEKRREALGRGTVFAAEQESPSREAPQEAHIRNPVARGATGEHTS